MMGKREKKVDVYIAGAAHFAQPILNHVRQLVHEACPGVEETIKWGFPHFMYGGILCSMASFKQHCSFGFWKASLMSDSRSLLSKMGNTAMGNFGHLRSLSNLPPDKTILAYVKEAVKLNEEGVSLPQRAKRGRRKPLRMPQYFQKALSKNKKAFKTFETFSYTNKRDYIDWIAEARTEETREKRLETALEWLSEGKIRNWKYTQK
jgi:uncharacterized protein YdeI (YjbR/CyaY-like superfamily)